MLYTCIFFLTCATIISKADYVSGWCARVHDPLSPGLGSSWLEVWPRSLGTGYWGSSATEKAVMSLNVAKV